METKLLHSSLKLFSLWLKIDHTKVNIILSPDLGKQRVGKKLNKVKGCVEKDGRYYNVYIRDSLDEMTAIQTLAHELVHVLQMESGRLVILGDRALWRGKDLTDLPYLAQPWERQAIEISKVIMDRYSRAIENVSQVLDSPIYCDRMIAGG